MLDVVVLDIFSAAARVTRRLSPETCKELPTDAAVDSLSEIELKRADDSLHVILIYLSRRELHGYGAPFSY